MAQRAKSGRVVITGTGRSGTTLLVQYFTMLNFWTGYSVKEAMSGIDEVSKAGLEKRLFEKSLPYVIKSPWIVDELDQVMRMNSLKIESIIIPIRNLFEAAESRREVYRQVKEKGGDAQNHPGTIWKTDTLENQEQALAMVIYKLVRALAVHGINSFLLPFPEFSLSHDVLFDRLRPLLKQHRVSCSESKAAFDRVVNPKLIHRFAGSDAVT